jgi:hypothetical protein
MTPEREKAIEHRQAIGRGEAPPKQPKKRIRHRSPLRDVECVCGAVFQTNTNKRYCSETCSNHAKKIRDAAKNKIYNATKPKKPPIEKPCSVCGNTFQATRATKIYCSDACKKIVHSRVLSKELLKERQCKICGKTFKPTRALMGFCSKQCRDYHNREKYGDGAEGAFGNKSVVKAKCPVCGKEYDRIFYYGWIGRGVPRMNCYSCEQMLVHRPSIQDTYLVYA